MVAENSMVKCVLLLCSLNWYFAVLSSDQGGTGTGARVFLPKGDMGEQVFAQLASRYRDGAPTKVWVTGTVSLFDAPTNISMLTGMQFHVESADAVEFASPSSRD